jgi:hypothetical protein
MVTVTIHMFNDGISKLYGCDDNDVVISTKECLLLSIASQFYSVYRQTILFCLSPDDFTLAIAR